LFVIPFSETAHAPRLSVCAGDVCASGLGFDYHLLAVGAVDFPERLLRFEPKHEGDYPVPNPVNHFSTLACWRAFGSNLMSLYFGFNR